jgi:ribosomal protein S6--L-glutamate ligase
LHEGGRRLPNPEVVIPRIGVVTTEHALSVLRQFEILRVPLTASAAAVRRSKDKMGCLQSLANAGVPIPETTLARQGTDAAWAVAAVGGPPVVLKFLAGTHGVGVLLADTEDGARSILEAMWSLEKNLLVQRYIDSAGQDLRLFVVGDRVVAAMRRTAPEGKFRSNLHSGGRAAAFSPSTELTGLALRSAQALGLRIAGVDIIESADGPLVLEVNSSPGLEGIEDVTGVDIAGAIADEAILVSEGADR